jgi:Family of unknown function (DUF6502)
MRIPHEKKSQDPIKETTISALTRVVDPLIDLMFDAGITVQEFSRLVRDRAVRSAAARVARECGRGSNSRVAIITGLARAEIARILETNKPSSSSRIGQHPARKVLAAWYDNPRFLGASGDPAVLPIFGKRKSFERLVAIHSGGIPVRAMLDQLTQISAVEILSGQRVKVKSRVPVFKGMTCSAIANVGERAGDLLSTLKSNLHTTSAPLFEGTAFICDVDAGTVPLVRLQMAEQGTAFIDGASSLLNRSRNRRRRSTEKSSQRRVGVTVYYFEDETTAESGLPLSADQGRRKNFQRQNNRSRASDK